MDRRSFLQTTALAVAGATLLPAGAYAAKRKLRKAIMYSTIGVKGTVLEKFKAMKAAGFEGVEPMGGMGREEVVAALKETGLEAASVCCHTHWAKPLSDPAPPVRQVGYDGLVLSLQDAKAYGASSVLLVPGVVKAGVTYEECFKRSVEEVKKAAVVAKDLGVKIAIENVWNNFITTPQQAVDYLDAIDSKWVGWHFDIGNVGRYSPAETWIPLLGKRILKLHIKEFNTKAMTEDKPGAGFGFKLMDGDNNWPAIMKALDKVGYKGWGISEQSGTQANSVETASDLAARMDKIFAL